jgi:hypothetical protein
MTNYWAPPERRLRGQVQPASAYPWLWSATAQYPQQVHPALTCRWRERLRGHARCLHLKLSSKEITPQLDFAPVLCLDGLRTLSLDKVGGSGKGEGPTLHAQGRMSHLCVGAGHKRGLRVTCPLI